MTSKQDRRVVICVYRAHLFLYESSRKLSKRAVGGANCSLLTPSCSRKTVFLALSCAILAGLFYAVLITPQEIRAEGETATIQITGPLQTPGFSPALLTVHANDYVIFINSSSPAATYAIAADDSSFTSPAIAPGKQWTVALNNPGEYEYHVTSSPKSMVGEILVVANLISLLPTPAPGISATAIAIIETGKTPPDNLAVPTPTPLSAVKKTQRTLPLAGLWPVSLLVQVESGIILLCLVIGGFFLIRANRRRLRKRKEAETEGSTELSQEQAKPRRRWLHWPKKKKKDEDEDDENEGEDE